MEYKELSKLYHMDSSSDRDRVNCEEAERRRSSESTFRTGFFAEENELFIAVPRELSVLTEKVLRKERAVSKKLKNLPGIAAGSMLRGLVLDEVVSSNLIEGVHSTRRQIKEALDSMDSEAGKKKRFKELAILYMAILDGTSVVPLCPEDVRKIYDKVMEGESAKNNQLDGEIFRAGGVDITDGIRVVHKGIEPEDKIIEAIQSALDVASQEDMPALYGALASHYLFEYAHPFYDGNGRTGRYLLALNLSTPLSMATSLSLSRTIAENKSAYYKAFETVQDPLNHGELTHFVYQMLELVNIAQEGILKRLDSAGVIFEKLVESMALAKGNLELTEQEANALFMLMQYEAYGLFGDAPLPDIANYLSVGNQMARRHMGVLEKKGAVEKIRGRNPVTFALTEEFKREYGIEALK